MTFEMTLGEHPRWLLLLVCFILQLTIRMNQIWKCAASNRNIKIHKLFSRQRILGVRVTIVKRKTSGGLKRTCS